MNRRWRRVLAEELAVPVRLEIARGVCALLAPFTGIRLRTAALRAAGVRIGRGTTVWGPIAIGGARRPAARLVIGERCSINGRCTFDVAAAITIGDEVAFGHEVLIVTGGHRIGPPERRAGALEVAPVRIDDGAWLGARVTVLPGVRIGRGAVVAAGALVRDDVEPDTLVAGVPARVIRRLTPVGSPGDGRDRPVP